MTRPFALSNPYASPVLRGVASEQEDIVAHWEPYDVTLAANQEKIGDYVTIDADAPLWLIGIIVSAAAVTSINFKVRFSRSGLYFMSSSYVHAANLVSDASSPAPVMPPLFFDRGSRIGIDIMDLSGAPNTIQILFVGNKDRR